LAGIKSRLSGSAVFLCIAFGLSCLLLASRALPQALRLTQPTERRSLEQPTAEFLQQIGIPGHVQVLQASPLHLAVTLDCDGPSRDALARQLHTFYGIQETLGEQLLVVNGPFPFHWEDHPRLAILLCVLGNALVVVGGGALLQARSRRRASGCFKLASVPTGICIVSVAVLSVLVAPLSYLGLDSHAGAEFQADLSRFLAAPPLAVAVLERDGCRRALVSRGTNDLNSLRPLVNERALALGFNPSNVSCIGFQRHYHFPFRLLGGLCLTLAGVHLLRRRRPLARPAEPEPAQAVVPQPSAPGSTPGIQDELESLHQLTQIDEICLEVGRSLLSLVDPNQGAPLLERITTLRRHVARQAGYVLPGVRFRDNLALQLDEYTLRIHGREVARGRVRPRQLLAMGPEERLLQLDGERVIEPAYGLEGVWITPEQREVAQQLNLMLSDPVSMIATHITQKFLTHAAEIFTFNACLELLKRPFLQALQVELATRGIDRVAIWKVLRCLLRQQVCIRDLQRILEGLLEMTEQDTPHESLVEFARLALRDSIVEELCSGGAGRPPQELVLWRVPLELLELLDQGASERAEMMEGITRVTERMKNAGHHPLLLVSPAQRPVLQDVLYSLPDIRVLSMAEIPDWAQVRFFYS